MEKVNIKKLFTVTLSFVLIAVTALTMTGCNSEKGENTLTEHSDKAEQGAETPKDVPKQGEYYFTFIATDKDGHSESFDIETDKKTVGEALIEKGLISGETGPYGLYVKEVNGTRLDFDDDGMYWAFYENGSYAQKGCELTEIVNGTTYEFKASK